MLEKLAKQTAVYGISTIVVRFLSYLLTPYYTRVFGQETYGVVTDIYPAAGNEDGKIDLCAECNPLHGPRVRALIEQLARGETPEKLSYMPDALFTADTLTAELLESRVY